MTGIQFKTVKIAIFQIKHGWLPKAKAIVNMVKEVSRVIMSQKLKCFPHTILMYQL